MTRGSFRDCLTGVRVLVLAGTRAELASELEKMGMPSSGRMADRAAETGYVYSARKGYVVYMWFVSGEYTGRVIVHECLHLWCRINEIVDETKIPSFPREAEELLVNHVENLYAKVNRILSNDYQKSVTVGDR